MTEYRTSHMPHSTHTTIEDRPRSSNNGIVLFILGAVVAALAILWFAMGTPSDSVVDETPAVTAPAPAAPMTADPAPDAATPEAVPEVSPAPDAVMPEAPATGTTTQP